MKQLFFIAMLIPAVINIGFGQSKTAVLTNKSIIDLAKAGLGDNVIISSINSSTCKFDVSSAGLIELKKQKLSDDVIKSMIDKGNDKPAVVKTQTDGQAADKLVVTKTAVSSKGSGLVIDLLNYVHVYNNNQAKPLEKSIAGIRTKQGMFGGSAMWQIDGAASSIRLNPGESNTFVINTGGAALPEMILYKVKSVKGRREVASMKVNTFSGVKTGEDVIAVDISKLKEGIYQLMPNKKLEKGEYFFAGKPVAGANSMDAFAFGID